MKLNLSFLERYQNFGLLVLRVGLGAMIAWHGMPKIIGGPSFWAKIGSAMHYLHIDYVPAFWGFCCAVTEFFGGLALVLGLFTRPVCILLTFNMIVASISMFVPRGLNGAAEPIELAFAFFGLIFIGAGRFSIDARMN